MRVFLALDVPGAVGEEIYRRVGRVKGELPAARWVAPGALHLTLAFLGELKSGDVDSLCGPLASVFGSAPPMRLHVRGIGSFPKRMPARVVWAEVEAEGDLVGLQERVTMAIRQTRGGEDEERAFHPHLTLARCRPPWPSSGVEKLRQEFGGPLSPEGFQIGGGTLFQSHLGPKGASYRILHTFPFEGGG